MESPVPTTPSLSVAIIVANDNESLARTLDSIREIADQIIVCDTGDAENAEDVVAPRGGHCIHRPWCDSFAAARNECLPHITGQWLLWLDAGETLSSEDACQLKQHLAGLAADTVYMLLVKVPPMPGMLDGEQVARLRLVPSRPDLRFRGRVRESLHEALVRAGMQIEGLPYRILRSVAEHDRERRQQRARRNIELADLEMRETGPQPRLHNCLAEAFLVLDQRADALAHFRQAIELAAAGSSDLLEAYCGLLTLEENNPDPEARMQIALQALEAFPLDMQLLCAMGGYLQAAGRWDLALRSYETAYRYGQIHPDVWHMDQLRAVAAECYALSLQLRGQGDAAREVLEEALAVEPESERLRRQLLELYVKQGDRSAALGLLDTHPPQTDNREALRSAVRGACLAAVQNWISARAYLQVAYQAGCRDALCMRYLAVTLMASGENAEATRILHEWHQCDPAHPEPSRYLEAMASRAPSPTAGRATESPDRQIRVDANRLASESPHVLGSKQAETPHPSPKPSA